MFCGFPSSFFDHSSQGFKLCRVEGHLTAGCRSVCIRVLVMLSSHFHRADNVLVILVTLEKLPYL